MTVLRIAAIAVLAASVALAQTVSVNNVTCPSTTENAFKRPAAECTYYQQCETTYCKCLGNSTASSTFASSCLAFISKNAPNTCQKTTQCLGAFVTCLEGVMYQPSLSAGCSAWVLAWNNALVTQQVSFSTNTSNSPFSGECRAKACAWIANAAGSACTQQVGTSYAGICGGLLPLTTTTTTMTPTTTSGPGATTPAPTTPVTTKSGASSVSAVVAVVAALAAIATL